MGMGLYARIVSERTQFSSVRGSERFKAGSLELRPALILSPFPACPSLSSLKGDAQLEVTAALLLSSGDPPCADLHTVTAV